MASLPSNIEALKGVWEFVDGENFEEYLKEMGKAGQSIIPFIEANH